MKNTCFITGASSGIGKALVFEYANQGYNTVLFARRIEKLNEIAAKLDPESTLVLQGDVTRFEDLEMAVSASLKKFGAIDTVFVNAGFGVTGWFTKLSLDDYRRQFETNVFGALATVKAAYPAILQTKGKIGILGSIVGFGVLPGSSAYGMSKSAIRVFAEAIRLEFASVGISVTHIAPGLIDTEIRRVDNKGVYRDSATDPAPKWLRMSSEKAAKKIFHAVESRKGEIVLTFHGKFFVFVTKHFPSLYSWIVRKLKVENRKPL